MSQYTKVGEIALWPNKEATGNQPVVTGTIKLESGKVLSVSLWKRKEGAHEDAPVYSGQVQSKEGDSAPTNSPAPQQEFDDDIPF